MGFELQSPWWKLFDLPDHHRLLARKVVLFFRLEADRFVCTNTNKINFGDYFTNSPETAASIHFPSCPYPIKCCYWHQARPRCEWHLLHTLQPDIWAAPKMMSHEVISLCCVCACTCLCTHASLSIRQVCAIGIYSSLFCVQLVIVCKCFLPYVCLLAFGKLVYAWVVIQMCE